MKLITDLRDFQFNSAASDEVITRARSETALEVPADYLQFMRERNGGEGVLGRNYLILWRVEELAPFNREYEVKEYAPGLLLFGSDGGGEAYAFDLRDAAAPVVIVPFVGLDLRYAEPVAKTFDDFIASQVTTSPIGTARDARHRGLELFDVTPVILGGDGTDPQNKAWLNREQHIQAVRYWNGVIKEL